MCLPDSHNLCDIVSIVWKRKYIDRRTKHSKTYLILCPDEWLVRHESPNQFVLKT